MARPLRLHVPGTLYHVTSRGNDKQQIFMDHDDHLKYLELLEKALARFDIQCSGYCLMWNHVHLLLTPKLQPISRLMQQAGSNYAQWFNWRHARCGHLLQGRFGARLIDNHIYFLRAHRYVVRNPVKANYVRDPADWPWSSYRATAGLSPAPAFLHLQAVWEAFGTDTRSAQKQFLEFAGSGADDDPLIDKLLCGSTDFAKYLEPELRPFRGEREFSYADRYASRPPLTSLVNRSLREEVLDAAIRDAFDIWAYTLGEIAEALECHPGTIWKRVRCGRRPAAEKPSALFE